MRKNQKYTQEEMYTAIELWKESGKAQKRFCQENNLSFSTFNYWQRKYKKDISTDVPRLSRSFIPIHIPQANNNKLNGTHPMDILIIYPNGVKVSCPQDIRIEQLRTLITIL